MIMDSKTPISDELIKNSIDGFAPHKRSCLWKGKHSHCESIFEITKEDIEFLKMFRVPAPNYCPTCRRIRRLTHLNLYRLFSIPCQRENHGEYLLSVFPKECPFPVWDTDAFQEISDGYRPYQFNENLSPIKNLLEMRKVFPMPNFLHRDSSIIDSEYSSGGRNLKNGYYVFGCFNSEDIWYTNHTVNAKNIMDSRVIKKSEFVYRGFFSESLYKCSFIYFSKNCTDSMFLYDCRNCTNCFGCVNLRNKSYCIWNKQYTREEYILWIKKNIPMSRNFIEDSLKKFDTLLLSHPVNASRNIQTQESMGVLLEGSSDLYDVVDAYNSQHIRHAEGMISHKDSMDLLFSGGHSHHLYMCTNVGSQSSNVKFSVSSKYCSDCEFIFNCKNLSNCFMCFGLQNKSFCIFNIQYTEEEYYKEVDRIKTLMIKSDEYGDGLGMEFSAQAYNFSLGNVSFPLTSQEIVSIGGYVGDEPESNVGNLEVVLVEDLPETIQEVDEGILQKAIMCPITKRPFRIIKSEFEFLKRMGLPLPIMHPAERMRRNFILAPEGKMYNAVCESCKKDIQSLYNPKNEYVLYCEECYKKEVL